MKIDNEIDNKMKLFKKNENSGLEIFNIYLLHYNQIVIIMYNLILSIVIILHFVFVSGD